LRLGGTERGVLTGERTALNFLQLLSGTHRSHGSTSTPSPARSAASSIPAKPFPACGSHKKYAVACGGGTNHRIGLFDAILIKETTLPRRPITAAVLAARKLNTHKLLEVEVENFAELSEALAWGRADSAR